MYFFLLTDLELLNTIIEPISFISKLSTVSSTRVDVQQIF